MSQNTSRVTLNQPSRIPEVNLEKELLSDWLGYRQLRLTLEYRATRDTFTVEAFHNRVDEKGPSIFFARSIKYNRVFGGFTMIPYEQPKDTVDCTHFDDEAFLFSLTQKTKHQALYNQGHAVKHWRKYYLIHFGGGADIAISEKCNRDRSCFSHLGSNYTTFELPEGITTSDEATKYFAGAKYFGLDEIEVYSVSFV
jgi:hypothetical protein